MITGLTRKQKTINCRGRILDLSTPVTMGIINLSPNSFYTDSITPTKKITFDLIEKHLKEGASIIDVGAQSTKPGSGELSVEDEIKILKEVVADITDRYPEAIFSIDSYKKQVIEFCLDQGWHIINDVRGTQNLDMLQLAVTHDVPYIVMHMQGEPTNMQDNPTYEHVTQDILRSFISSMKVAEEVGLKDLIIDPGFGFAKTLQQNYQLLNELEAFNILDLPILVGLSRKSMIYKLLNLTPELSQNGTTALHTMALERGANILRVHDVAPAQEAIILHNALRLTKS